MRRIPIVSFIMLVLICFFISAICGTNRAFSQSTDKITVVTYYPSPYGIYDSLKTNKFAIGSSATVPNSNGVVTFQGLTGGPNASGGSLCYDSSGEFKYCNQAGGCNVSSDWKSLGGSALGNWEVKSANTVYLAATSGLVCAYTPSSGTAVGYTDSNNPPTTVRQSASLVGSGSQSITMPVRKGDYWEVTGNPSAVYWISF